MRTNKQLIKIHHSLGDVQINTSGAVSLLVLKRLIELALDSYIEFERVSAEDVHEEVKKRHGKDYQTPGYYVRIYRVRADMTQTGLAKKLDIKQHHISEIEHNKRIIGKKLAMKIAKALNFDYKKLL